MSDLISAREAARRLAVKPATLYSYVSRGKLRRVSGPDGRSRLYLAADVERLRARSAARSGHAAVAEGALRWGEPVLDTSICKVGEDGIFYRDRSLASLIDERVGFEAVCALLWEVGDDTGDPPANLTPWLGPPQHQARDRLSLTNLQLQLLGASQEDPRAFPLPAHLDKRRAQALLRLFAAAVAPDAPTADRALTAPTLAAALAVALGVPDGTDAIETLLICCAEHGLNVSTFTARIAASTRVDIFGCLGAALHCFSGPMHGRSSVQLWDAVVELEATGDIEGGLHRRIESGQTVHGFGHRLYPKGDPRASILVNVATGYGDTEMLDHVLTAGQGMAHLGQSPPNLDFGVVAVVAALGLPREACPLLFAFGRIAGWVAHIFEQRQSPGLLRPRARYVR